MLEAEQKEFGVFIPVFVLHREDCLLIWVGMLPYLSWNLGIRKLYSILAYVLDVFISDVSTTTIVKPGPVIDFLLSNQSVREPRYIDWTKVTNN